MQRRGHRTNYVAPVEPGSAVTASSLVPKAEKSQGVKGKFQQGTRRRRSGRPGIGLVRIRQINSPYHTNINKSITISSVYTIIPLAGKVALATWAIIRGDMELENLGHMGRITDVLHGLPGQGSPAELPG